MTEVESDLARAPGAQRVRFYRDLFGSIKELKGSLRTEKKKEIRWKRAFWSALVAALLASGLAIGAITSSSKTYEGASGQVITYTEDLTVSINGHLLPGTTLTSSTTAELTAVTFPTARTAISLGDWYYQITVQEAAAGQITSGSFSAELLQDGTSLGTLTITQNTDDDNLAGAEGVVLQWSLGSSTLPSTATYVVKIS